MLQDENDTIGQDGVESPDNQGATSSNGGAGPKLDLGKYNDEFDGPSLKELNFGLWLAQKRKQIRRFIIIVLIAVSVALFAYSVYSLIIYFQSGPVQVSDGSVPTSPRKLVSDLQVGPVQVFHNSGSSDLAVRLVNPNIKFSASFNYCFSQNNENIKCGSSFILPGGHKYIFDLNQDLPQNGSIKFSLSSLSWKRLNEHNIPDWAAYYNGHVNFPVNGLNFQPAANNSLTHMNLLSFSVSNNSPYSYYQVPLNILFFNGQTLVGVQSYFLENFSSGASRNVSISWPDNLPGVTNTEIQPDLNILDNSIYAPYNG